MTTLQTLSDLRKRYPKSWLLEYIEKAKSGEEIIGNELMLMLDILIGHFENPTAIFPDGITFDTSESDIRIKFIETKVKHFEAPFAGKPFILTLRQKAYIEAFYSFKIYDEEVGRRVRLFQERIHLVGRKCGKTPLEAAMDLAEFFCGEMGTRILCSSNDYISIHAPRVGSDVVIPFPLDPYLHFISSNISEFNGTTNMNFVDYPAYCRTPIDGFYYPSRR